jgi:hypothetical protein
VSRTGFDGKEGKWYKKEKLLQNKEEPNKGTSQEEPARGTKVKEPKRGSKKKKKPPASIEENLILAGGKILRLRSE